MFKEEKNAQFIALKKADGSEMFINKNHVYKIEYKDEWLTVHLTINKECYNYKMLPDEYLKFCNYHFRSSYVNSISVSDCVPFFNVDNDNDTFGNIGNIDTFGM